MKRVLIFLMIAILALSCLCAEVTQKALVTSFTAAGECFIGFSRKNVTNTIMLQTTEKFSESDIIGFTFDPLHGYYYTDVFYAYCQSFVDKPLTVTISAPAKIHNETDNQDTDAFTYQLIYDGVAYDSKTGKVIPKPESKAMIESSVAETQSGVSGVWTTDANTISYTHNESTDPLANTSGPRVVLSQPILIKIPESTAITRGKKYSITFTLEVRANA